MQNIHTLPAPSASPAPSDPHTLGCCGEHASSPPSPLLAKPKGTVETRYHIQNMDCPMEESLIRKKLDGMSGIHVLNFNLIQRVLTVYHNLDATGLEGIMQALNSIAMYPTILEAGHAPVSNERAVPWIRLSLACTSALTAELIHLAEGSFLSSDITWWISLSLALFAIALGGLDTYKKGWISLRNFDLNMNALMSFAVTGAVLIGQFPEAAMVMVLFSIAEIVEDKSIGRARNAIQELLTLTPEQATMHLPDGSWQAIDSKDIALDSIIRVKPGERIALDGIVVLGSSAINQAPITGESLPVEKNIGDTVFAGTINEAGSLEYKTTALSTNSTIARIMYAVEEAQQNKAPIQRFVDQFARIYTPCIFLMAILVATIQPIFYDADWFTQIYKALVLLVIACPCALVISTPVSIVSALAAATRHGLLIKGGAFLEQGRKLTCIALDKTGTITQGTPRLVNTMTLTNIDKDAGFRIAASLADRSDHPVSKAIAKEAHEKDLELFEVTDFTAIPGQGIHGNIDGKKWYLGNMRLLVDKGYDPANLQQITTPLEQEGQSLVFLMAATESMAPIPHVLFSVADTIRESSIEAIKSLKRMGIKTIMLTGDNAHTAAAVAAQVGVDAVEHSLLPEDKLRIITQLGQNGRVHVGMVGDGINDAPALAQADIGFAMAGMGTDAAIETADVAIMDDDLRKIPTFIGLSRATFWILTQNISLALGIKSIFFALTLMGAVSMWMAVFADIGVSLLVIANGLRLLRK